ncbi:PHP domain-containing protein [Sediminispirochaeta bajacaliforniensis]|uniref:PHP domain-containing protein n=1 Tax=Sediminispirochaeta bajacaliforniensis TaxID=148 RepID=UPI000382615A|nr:PHP domain-containing protein [Sediminispirochaeta bajacaliforniensis]
MKFRADLHIHSCLSPCGSLEMSPARIITEAEAAGLDLLALTDHNCARNLRAFDHAARKSNITPIFGIEVNSIEEAHVLCLFPTVKQAEELGDFIENRLPQIPNNPDLFGDQVYVDEHEFILGEVEVSLLQGAEITLEELLKEVKERGGLFIPAHIDRPSFSVVSQLGFLPRLDYSAVECVTWPPVIDTADYCVITDSDAHYPQDIAKRSFTFEADSPTFEGLYDALAAKRVTPQKRS